MKKLFIIMLVSGFIFSANLQANDYVQIHGYTGVEFEYLLGDEEDGKADPNGSIDSDIFDIIITANVTDRFRIAADLTWEHGAATEDGFGNVAMEFAFGEYRIFDWLNVRAGKMFSTFGIYNEIHTAKPLFLSIKEPLSTNKPYKFGSEKDQGRLFFPRWISGVMLFGNSSISDIDYDWSFQISNGTQYDVNPYDEDINGQKAFAGRLRFEPLSDLRIGGSFFTDKMTQFDDAGEPTDDRISFLSYGLQAEYTIGDFGLEAECMAGSYEPIDIDPTNRFAYYATVYYTLGYKYTPFFRYEYLEPNVDVDDDTANLMIIGLNIEIDDNLFFKLELNNYTSDDGNIRFKGKKFSEIKAAIAMGF